MAGFNRGSTRRMLLCGGLLLAWTTAGHAAVVQVAPVMADVPGGEVSVPISLFLSPEEDASAVQFDLLFDAYGLALLEVNPGASALESDKTVGFNLVAEGTVRVVIAGLNQNILSSGTLAEAVFQVPSSPSPVTWCIGLARTVVSGPFGDSLPVEAISGYVAVGGSAAACESEGEGQEEGEAIEGEDPEGEGEDTEGEIGEGEGEEGECIEGEAVEGETLEGETGEGEEGESAEGEISEGEAAEGEIGEGEMSEGESPEGQVYEGEAMEGEEPEGQANEGEDNEGQTPEGETGEGEMLEGESSEGETGEGEMLEGESSEGETTEGESSEGEVLEGEGVEGESSEGEASEGESMEGESREGEATEGQTAEGEEPEGEWQEGAPEGASQEGEEAEGEDDSRLESLRTALLPHFDRLDQNGDGLLTYPEAQVQFSDLSTAEFDALDADGSGGLSAEELGGTTDVTLSCMESGSAKNYGASLGDVLLLALGLLGLGAIAGRSGPFSG